MQATSMFDTSPLRRIFIRSQGQSRRRIIAFLTIISFFVFASVSNRNEYYSSDLLTLRLPFYKDHQKEPDPIVSYCSWEADRRGPQQNVISYSLYGNFSDPKHFKRYAEPIKFILANISQFYPGWVMRVYSPLEPGNSIGNVKLKELFRDYPLVDLCNVTRVLELRNINRPVWPDSWRFLALLDPLVDRMLCRDTDSLVTEREVAAVNQWLDQSTATFHLMHDHPHHCSTKFLGASWGVKVHQNRDAIFKAAGKIFYNARHKLKYAYDQVLLNKFLWPYAINDSMHHDSYCCKEFNNSIPFPTRRIGAEYVAQYASGESAPLPETCPEECRPKDHPEWTRC